MLKNKIALEVKINDRSYSLELMPDSPLGEIHDVLLQMQSFVFQKMQEAHKTYSEINKQSEEPTSKVEVING